jgi:hypothetical protein
MAKRIIRTGTTADPTGDSLKNAFTKVNDNFTELYNALGLDADTLNLGAFEFSGSVMSTTDSSAITIDQAVSVTSNLTVGGDILPQTANGGDLGNSTYPWRSLYVSNNTIYIGGTSLSIDSSGNLRVNGSAIADVGTAAWVNITGKPTFATVATSGSYSDLSGRPSFGNITFDSQTITTSVTGGDVILQAANHGAGNGGDVTLAAGTGTANNGIVQINTAGTYTWTFDNGGNTSFPGRVSFSSADGDITGSVFGDDSTILVDGVNNKIRGNVQTATAWSVTVGDYTSTFGTDGSLTLPPAGSLSTGSINFTGSLRVGTRSQYQFEEITDESGPSTIYYSKLSLPEIAEIFAGNELSLSTWGTELAVKVRNPGNFSDHTWSFNNNGSLTIPGGIKSEGEINIDINLSDSTLHRWTFGEDGVLNLPGALKNVRIDDNSITLGYQAGLGGNYTVAIGYLAGNLSQGQSSVAIGDAAGTDQGARSVAVGNNAGNTDQGDNSVAIGNNAGTNVQATLSVAVGSQAGQYTQGQQATAVGSGAGNLTQANGTVAVGANAGAFTQGQRAVAVGSLAGADNQGEYAVALGNYAGAANQPAHSIVINATGQPFNGSAAGFFVDPIRNIDGGAFLNYNASTKEIGYNNDISREEDFSISINLTDSTQRIWRFGEDGDLNIPGNIVADRDEDIVIQTEGYVMSSPPGYITRSFTFGADGNLNVPGAITGGTDGAYLQLTGSSTINLSSPSIYIGYGSGSTSGNIIIGGSSSNRISMQSPRLQILANAPTSSKGSDGDFVGMVAFDGSYIYYCAGLYDGVTDIWKRVSLTGGTW